MRLSTSTVIYFNRRDGSRIPLIESIRRCGAAGYRVMDLDFASGVRFDDYELNQPDWEAWADAALEMAAVYGIEFSQAHAPSYNVADLGFAQRDYYDEMLRRSILVCGRLGVKWLAVHAGTALDQNRFIEASKARNIEYFLPVIELADKNGLGIAIENMQEYMKEWRVMPRRRYTAGVEEQCDLIDAFHSKRVGAVWDFGHANITGQDQAQSLRYIGKRLKATHVHDNSGFFDDHTLPFLGTIDWPGVMAALAEIAYEGDFTYELARYTIDLPEALVDDAIKASLKVGKYLLSL